MTEVLHRVRAALASEPRLDLHNFPIELSFAQGTLTLEGEVGDVAAKKLALERAAGPARGDRYHRPPAGAASAANGRW